jgi:hypothetical protein
LNRRFTFSDKRVIYKIRTGFIPVTGNTWVLQFQKGPVRDWFTGMADRTRSSQLKRQRRESGTDDTVQGFFIAGADGTSYGWDNDFRPEGMLQFIDQGLRRFRRNPPRPVTFTRSDPGSQTATPSSVAVVRVFTRLAAVPGGRAPEKGVQRDTLWLYADELRTLRDLARGGRPFALPPTLAARIARFHLVDNVRGEPDMWRPGEVEQVSFKSTGVRQVGPAYEVSFRGDYDLHRADGRRSLNGRIEGEITLDVRTARLIRFRAYADGKAERVGKTGDRRRFRLLIAMVEATDAVARVVPPEAVTVGYASEYRSPRIGRTAVMHRE